MPGIDLAAFAERIRTLNAPDQGMNYRGAHSGERRYNELDGKEYYTRGEPATLTVYGDRAQLLYDLIRNCAEIAAALSTPVAQGDEVRDLWSLEQRLTDGEFFSDYDEDLRLLGVFRRHVATLTKGALDAG